MQAFVSNFWENHRFIQTIFWLVFPLLVSIPLFQKYPIDVAFWSTLSTATYLYWLVFGHYYLGLPFLIGPANKKGVYLFRLLLVIAIGVAIHGAFSILLFDELGEKEYSILVRPWSFVIWTSIECLLIILISSMMQFSFAYFKLQSQQQQMANQQLEAELKYLKLQINPHFLFNTLNNLLLLTNKRSPQASVVVEKLAYMMRYLLEKDRKKQVPLHTEIDFINAYIDLERIRVKDTDISFDLEGDLNGHSLPPALLITLVENAFKHGINKSATANFVHLELKASPDEITFEVTNPLHSHSSNRTKETGIGLQNLRKRLQLLFPDRHHLQVGPTKQETFGAHLTIQV
ncbi:MAG: histidine kinase [Saprospiraceae bacterium]|nr:histidine kinase [Saprospiraceae bacterium]